MPRTKRVTRADLAMRASSRSGTTNTPTHFQPDRRPMPVVEAERHRTDGARVEERRRGGSIQEVSEVQDQRRQGES